MKKLLASLVYVCDVAFLAGLLAIPVLWLISSLTFAWGPLRVSASWGWRPFLVTASFLLGRMVIAAAIRCRGARVWGLLGRRVVQKLILALTMTCLCFGLLEGTLVALDFRVNMAPVIFELDNESGETEVTEGYQDSELRWKFRKGERYDGRTINSLGYRDREVDPVKRPGVKRVICMGDSVTAQGHPPYSQYLHDRLTNAPPGSNAWEAFNMAVYGYSSMQGLRVFQLEAAALEPDIVTIFFGWNDHWLEMKTDRARMAVKVHPLYGRLYNRLKNKRFFMLLTQLLRRSGGGDQVREKAGFRVPPEEYVAVLTEFVEAIREEGAIPILITAPRREVHPNKIKFPEESRRIDYNAVHDRYAELTRDLAARLNVDLLDLHRTFSVPACDAYFLKDGIHFKQEGLAAIARELDARIRAIVAHQAAGGGG